MTTNLARPVLPLESVALQVTPVLPIRKRLPDLGVQRTTGATTSLSSRAVTVKRTRRVLAPFAARTVLFVAPVNVGRVVSNSSPGTLRVPVHVSVPLRPLYPSDPSFRSTVPLPDAPA